MRVQVPNLLEGVANALGAMRAHKLRSALTILGVVIGVGAGHYRAYQVERKTKQRGNP
jgi:uncharacterized membrane protein YebE (DUF533 family)